MAEATPLSDDDLIANILAWLPPKHVAQARLVCKRWRALTSEHHFMLTNFARSRAGGNSISGFFLCNELHKKFSYSPLHGHGTANHHHLAPDLSFIPSHAAVAGEIYITSSCNGLLICRRPVAVDSEVVVVVYKARYYVCNPVTRKFIEVASMPQEDDEACNNMNLAYDPSRSPHYKIVTWGFTKLQVYSSQTRSWRTAVEYERTSSPFAGVHHSHAVFWNGSLVWVVSHSLLRFAVDEQELTMPPMPPRPDKGWICGYVGESGGRLHMIGYTHEESLAARIDVLKMAADCSGWSVLYHVDLTRVVDLYPDVRRKVWVPEAVARRWRLGGNFVEYLHIRPFHVTRGTTTTGSARQGELLFAIPAKIMSYKVEDGKMAVVWEETVTPPARFFDYCWFDFYPFSPGLFDV